MEVFQAIGAWLMEHREVLFKIVRVMSVLAIILGSATTTAIVFFFPIRIRLGVVRLDGLIKLIAAALVVCWMVLASSVVIFSPTFVGIAKFLIINVMIAVSVTAWVLLLTWPQISAALTAVQQECELATNLTFLQAEMARAQLESVNDRIQRAIQPEEVDATQTLLKTISPLVSMFVRRETSVIKWSMAVVDVGKHMMAYFKQSKK